MSSLDKPAARSITPGVRFFLCACVFCLGIHFLVNDMAFFNVTSVARGLMVRSTTLRFADNDHQEDTFFRIDPMINQTRFGLTRPVFDPSISGVTRSISPLFPPPKA